ncbi:MAG: molybdopterin molybdenumtransferase MoeA, partial [Thermoplasmatota archaeon]
MVEQRPFGELITYDEALDSVLNEVSSVDRTEMIPITEASGRVLAEDQISSIDVPPFDRAAMDGFAVRAEDTYGAGKFDPINLEILEN